MSKIELPVSGTCRCGQTGIRLDAQPVMTAACHCIGCQRMSASAYSLTAIVPASGFTVIAGEPVVGGLHGPEQHHQFCPHCMTWMFTRIDGFDEFVNIRPTLLSDTSWFVPFIETMTAEKLPWSTTPAVHSFEGFPPMDRFQSLLEAFSRRHT